MSDFYDPFDGVASERLDAGPNWTSPLELSAEAQTQSYSNIAFDGPSTVSSLTNTQCGAFVTDAAHNFTDDQSAGFVLEDVGDRTLGFMLRANFVWNGSGFDITDRVEAILFKNGSNAAFWYKAVKGASTVSSYSTVATWASILPGDLFAAQAVGDTIKLFQNGVQLGSDVSHPNIDISGGQPGIILREASIRDFDAWDGAYPGVGSHTDESTYEAPVAVIHERPDLAKSRLDGTLDIGPSLAKAGFTLENTLSGQLVASPALTLES